MADRTSGMQLRDRPALEALNLLSQKWHPVVITTLSRGEPIGFNELLDAISGISGKVLSETLESLRESGLVNRKEISESPLRVEYNLTSAGHDLEPIFEALGEWGETHLEHAIPQVLLAAGDRRITEMYRQWLSDYYAVSRAHDGETLHATLTDSIDLVLLDDRIPGIDTRTFVGRHWPEVRTILLVDDRPRFDVLDVQCDDILRKPIVRDTVLEAVDKQLSFDDESAEHRELSSLEARRSVFESVYSSERLEADKRYHEVCERIEELANREPGSKV